MNTYRRARTIRKALPPSPSFSLSSSSSPAALALGAMLAFAVPAGAMADADALDRIPVPPDADSVIVSTDLVQNGMRTSIATLEPADSVDDALAFYRGAWADELDGHPGFVENEAGGWSIISRLEGDDSLVVQLRDGPAGTEGFLSASIIAPAEIPDRSVPLPAGGERLSTTSVQDIGSSADTTIVSAPGRPGDVAAFYRDRFARDGWELVSERSVGGPHVLTMQRPDERFELVVVDSEPGGSMAILNEIHDR